MDIPSLLLYYRYMMNQFFIFCIRMVYMLMVAHYLFNHKLNKNIVHFHMSFYNDKKLVYLREFY